MNIIIMDFIWLRISYSNKSISISGDFSKCISSFVESFGYAAYAACGGTQNYSITKYAQDNEPTIT